jgi:hypothetical protein
MVRGLLSYYLELMLLTSDRFWSIESLKGLLEIFLSVCSNRILAPSPIGASMESLGNIFGLIHMYGKERPVQSLQLRQSMHPVYLYISFSCWCCGASPLNQHSAPPSTPQRPAFPASLRSLPLNIAVGFLPAVTGYKTFRARLGKVNGSNSQDSGFSALNPAIRAQSLNLSEGELTGPVFVTPVLSGRVLKARCR